MVVEASLDNLRSDDVRFLEEAAALGSLRVRVPSDELVAQLTGAAPVFPAAERLFLAESLRWVEYAEVVDVALTQAPDALDDLAAAGATLAVREEDEDPALRSAAEAAQACRTGSSPGPPAPGSPSPTPPRRPPGTPRVVVTGCYDWLHSGHIRFFMDAAAYGALYAVVGSDRNVELLKGPGHPLQREDERRYMVGAVQQRAPVPRLVGLRLDGRGARDRRDRGHPLRRQRGRRPAREARVLPGARHRVRGAAARAARRVARPVEHGAPGLLGHVPTLLDVARRAGVSPMTVSRVVNGSGPVSPALRARVEQALAETGYMPNTLARNLRAQADGHDRARSCRT